MATTNAQTWLDQNYPKEKRNDVKELDISGWNDKDGKWEVKTNWEKLTGELDLSDFSNLEKLNCSSNQITSLTLPKNSEITEIKCWENELKEIKFPSSPLKLETFYAWTNYLTKIDWDVFNPENLVKISISNNNLKKQDLKVFSQFTNLEELYLGNDIEERLENKICNLFFGSLESLKNLTKLKKLQIEETDIEEDFQYLPKGSQIISWRKEAIIKQLGLDKNGEEAKKIRNANKKSFSKVLREIVVNYYVKKLIGSDLTYQQKKEIEEISNTVNINTRSKKEFENGLEEFKNKLDKFIEEKRNEMITSIIPLERLYVIRGNAKQFLKKWGIKDKDNLNQLSELNKLKSPEELWKYRWAIYGTNFIGRGSAVAGVILTFQGLSNEGTGVLAAYPFAELVISKLEENLKNKEDKWKEFLEDADKFLDNYHELMGILAPFETEELKKGEVNKAIKNLDKKVKEFLEIYDEDGNKEIDVNELVNKRHKLIQDLNKEENKIQEIIKTMERLEEAIIKYRKSSYYGTSQNKAEENIQSETLLPAEISELFTNTELKKEMILKEKIEKIKDEELEIQKNELEIQLRKAEIDHYKIKEKISVFLGKQKQGGLEKQFTNELIKNELTKLEQEKEEAEKEIDNIKSQLTRTNLAHLGNKLKNLGSGNWWSYKTNQVWEIASVGATKVGNLLITPYWYGKQLWYVKENTKIWKNINPNFTPKLILEWKEQSFTYKECEDWIRISSDDEQNEVIKEPNFYAWLRDKKELTPEVIAINLTDLRKQYQEDKQKDNDSRSTESRNSDKSIENLENYQVESKEDYQVIDLDKHFEEKETELVAQQEMPSKQVK